MKEERSLAISIWVPKRLAERIQNIADRERRSRSSVVRNLLLDTFAAKVMNGKPSNEEERDKQA